MLWDIILSMPLFSFLLVLTAGTLIGYAICYPFVGETKQVSDDSPIGNQIAIVTALYGEARAELDQLRAERDTTAEEATILRSEIERTQEHARLSLRTIDKIREQREEVLIDLRQAQSERARVANHLRDAEAEVDNLRRQLRQVVNEARSDTHLLDEYSAAKEEIAQLSASRAQLENAYAELRKAHAMLHQELGHRQTLITRLRHERDGAMSALARQESIVAGIAVPAGVDFSLCYESGTTRTLGKVA